MRWIGKIFLFLSMTFFMTSCIKVDMTYLIDKDGTATVEMVYDYTQFYQMTESMSQQLPNWSGSTNQISRQLPCDTMTEGDAGFNKDEYTSITCENLDEYRAKVIATDYDMSEYLTKKIDLQGNDYLELDVSSSIQAGTSNKQQTQEQAKQQVQQLKAMGLEMNFVFQFKWWTLESNFWEIENDTFSFSIYDTIDVEDSYLHIYYDENVPHSISWNDAIDEENEISKGQLYKQFILSRNILQKTSKWKKRVEIIDTFFRQSSENKLKKLAKRLEKVNKKSQGYIQNEALLKYLEAGVLLELYK